MFVKLFEERRERKGLSSFWLYLECGSFTKYFLTIVLCCVSPIQIRADEPLADPKLATSALNAWKRLSDADVWSLLPEVASGDKTALPNWAKAVATQMPRTAAAMIELDAAFRTLGPLDPVLRAKLRWIIAHSNQCKYSESYALADLHRAGGETLPIEAFLADKNSWPASDADALEFARLQTLAASTTTDELFQKLRDRYGDRQVAAMVLLTAYGNFQDRILLGLSIPLEENAPLEPSRVKFVAGALQVAPLLPPENGAAIYQANGQAVTEPDREWNSISYDQLQARLEQQRHRQPRLPIPTWDEVKGALPTAMGARPTAIRWSLMNYGYAPELAIPWTIATRTHWAEHPSDRVLEESLFWIQTRAIECNYCMGHCEMLLEVAGLDKPAVAKRTRLLAESDWASFPATEQRAYSFARKLSRKPSELTPVDYQTLESDFGNQQAMSIFWWLCRGLYMTRISDGFQLPLEGENVFGGHAPAPVEANSEN